VYNCYMIGHCSTCHKNTKLLNGLCVKCQKKGSRADSKNAQARLRQHYYSEFGPISKMPNWRILAVRLSDIAGRDRQWTARYIRSTANNDNGFAKVPSALADAISVYTPQNIFTPGGYATGDTTSQHKLPTGTLIQGEPRQCAYCNIWFVPEWGNQLYHRKECKRAARNKRRRQKRLNRDKSNL